MMRRLNPVFLAILVVGLALSGGGMHLVHRIQLRRNAASLLDRASARRPTSSRRRPRRR